MPYFPTLMLIAALLLTAMGLSWLAHRRHQTLARQRQQQWQIVHEIDQITDAHADVNTLMSHVGRCLQRHKIAKTWHVQANTPEHQHLIEQAEASHQIVVQTRQALVAMPTFDLESKPCGTLSLTLQRSPTPEINDLLTFTWQRLNHAAKREAHRLQRQQKTAQQREQLAQLSLVASRINHGVVIVDARGDIAWANERLQEFMPYFDADQQSSNLIDLLQQHALHHEHIKKLPELLQSGQNFKLTYAITPTGHTEPIDLDLPSTRWFEIEGFAANDDASATQQHIILLSEVTQRKASDDQREEGHAFQEALLANLPISLFVIDASTLKIVALNRHAETEFDLKPEKVIDRHIEQAIGAEITQRVQPHMQASDTSAKTVEHDFSWRDRVINARHFTVRYPDGRPRLYISLARDITAAQKARQDLEESERRFREVVESLDDAIYVTDGARITDLYISPQMSALLCHGSTSLSTNVSDWLRDVVIPDDRATLAHQENIERQSESTDILLRLDLGGRDARWVRHKTRSRRLNNGETRIYGVFTDVTEDHQQAVALRKARDEAEAASIAKTQFMANMSHEIRTPMNGILGMTELLLGTELTDKQKRFAQSVYRSGETLLNIVNDILDFSAIESGAITLSPRDFQLRDLIEDVLESQAPRAHGQGLELILREGPNIPEVIHADDQRLRQVLTNLVANAIKFTEHGEVVVEVVIEEDLYALAPAHNATSSCQLTFRVRDTGIGIKAEALPQIFSAFVQGQNSNTRRYGGTGLGLPISKQLVELMGGQLQVRSMPAIGSEFSFTLTVGTQPHASKYDKASLSPHTVLVVDDNTTQRDTLKALLTNWGMQVLEAETGAQALDMLTAKGVHANAIDLAFIDLRMPELDGLSMIDILKRHHQQLPAKLILMASQATTEETKRAHDAGFEAVIRKPLRKIELWQTLQNISYALSKEVRSVVMGQAKRVLVVEDNAVNQEVCVHMLRRLGCEVRVASSALEGLRRLGEQCFDLILMDIQMPGMDGIEALSWFRQGSNKRFTFVTPPHTPVIAVTANALEGDEQRFLDLGFDDYLSKPFRQGQLQHMLQMHTNPQGSKENPPPSNQEEDAPRTTSFAVLTDGAEMPILDANTLQRLLELDPKGDNHLLDRLTHAFETSLSRLLPQIDEAYQHNDLATIGHVAHTLKSSSASIGALKLSQLCADTEHIIRRQSGEDLSSRIREIPLEADRVRAALKQLLEAQT